MLQISVLMNYQCEIEFRENNTWTFGDTEFLFECSTFKLKHLSINEKKS